MKLDSPVTELKGIGEKTEKLLQKIGVYTVSDILLHYPRNYIRFEQPKEMEELKAGDICALAATIRDIPKLVKARSLDIVTAVIKEGNRKLELVWYRSPYIKNQLKAKENYIFYGKISEKNHVLRMEQPEIYTPDQYRKKMETLQPIYSITKGISNQILAKTVRQVFNEKMLTYDYLPETIRQRQSLCEFNYALFQVHFPEDLDRLTEARKRLVFDEFFLFLLNMQLQREKAIQYKNEYLLSETEEFLQPLIKKLPYELTKAQLRCLKELLTDFKRPVVMQRLIQGDVGSGKTILAFLSMALMWKNGFQSAIMAPTEVLARQHYELFTKMCEEFTIDIPVLYLSGSLTGRQKQEVYAAMQETEGAIIVGTQALIQEKAQFRKLGLVITDEQHRFGVRQRQTLAEKGLHPHILVMSATPIPRTLAIILYGDFDISVIDEVPAKRKPIKNCVVNNQYRGKAYQFMEKEIAQGHQIYVICPLVEKSESMEAENVEEYSEKLKDYFPAERKIGCLNGKMKPQQKNDMMQQFSAGELDILVSTTVVEVGVNVPNATVMMIENAERFGLAQLHQLRGRVGRGDAQSYCIMVNGSDSKASKKRLEILNRSNDGFFIASEDLKLRGPGDFLGIRQSGEMSFRLADIYQDAGVLKRASEEVKKLLSADPQLKREEHQKLIEYLQRYQRAGFEQLPI